MKNEELGKAKTFKDEFTDKTLATEFDKRIYAFYLKTT